jgi:hypothetical protein
MIDEPEDKRPLLPDIAAAKAPRPEKLLAIIQMVAVHSERVVFSEHAEERMVERGISDIDVYRALQRGSITGPIRPGKNKGEWGCKVSYRIRGSRDIGVVTIVICEKTLWVKTVEWEDIK